MDVLTLEARQAWSELRSIDVTHLSGDELARAYIAKSKAYQHTATTVEEYRECLRYSRLAEENAVRGGYIHLWALARVAIHLADLCDFAEARRVADEFFCLAGDNGEVVHFGLWVHFALGLSFYFGGGNYKEAIRHFIISSGPLASEELKERSFLNFSWCYAHLGDGVTAMKLMPKNRKYVSDGNHYSVLCAALFASKRWSEAVKAGRIALKFYDQGGFMAYDTLDAAEVSLILKKCAERLGCVPDVIRWVRKTDEILSRWTAGVTLTAPPTLRGEGGGMRHEEVSHRWIAGHHRTGLLGTVG